MHKLRRCKELYNTQARRGFPCFWVSDFPHCLIGRKAVLGVLRSSLRLHLAVCGKIGWEDLGLIFFTKYLDMNDIDALEFYVSFLVFVMARYWTLFCSSVSPPPSRDNYRGVLVYEKPRFGHSSEVIADENRYSFECSRRLGTMKLDLCINLSSDAERNISKVIIYYYGRI